MDVNAPTKQAEIKNTLREMQRLRALRTQGQSQVAPQTDPRTDDHFVRAQPIAPAQQARPNDTDYSAPHNPVASANYRIPPTGVDQSGPDPMPFQNEESSVYRPPQLNNLSHPDLGSLNAPPSHQSNFGGAPAQQYQQLPADYWEHYHQLTFEEQQYEQEHQIVASMYRHDMMQQNNAPAPAPAPVMFNQPQLNEREMFYAPPGPSQEPNHLNVDGMDARQPSPVNIGANGMAQMSQSAFEQVQHLDARQRFNKGNKEEVLKYLGLLAAILVCLYFLPDNNIGCDFDSTHFLTVFMYYVIAPELSIRFIFLGFWRSTRYLYWRKLSVSILQPLLYASWLIYTMIYYGTFTPQCYEPFPSFGLCVYCVVMVFILPSAFLVICAAAFAVLFCPCIAYAVIRAFMDSRERSQLKDRVVKSLSKISYDSTKFTGQNECAICLMNFEADAQITPLSCDIRHYFHSDCIEQWMKHKNECPLCKKEIDPQSLKDFSKELERMAREDNAVQPEGQPRRNDAQEAV